MEERTYWAETSTMPFSADDCMMDEIRADKDKLEFIFDEGIWIKAGSGYEKTDRAALIFKGIKPEDILCYKTKKRIIKKGYIRKYEDFERFMAEMKKNHDKLEVIGMYREYKRVLLRCNAVNARHENRFGIEIELENIEGFEVRAFAE